jgi:hypothetical protein
MSRIRPRFRRGPSRAAAVLATTLGVATLAACGSQPVQVASKTPTPAAKTPTPAPPTPAPPPPATPAPTIVAGATYKAPAIVQVENLNDARPQAGLGSANVVYEYSAEGGIGRFSAIYFSTPQGQVGPIRSARLVSPVLTKQYGGSLVFSGSSQFVFGRMNAENTPRFDETSAGPDMFRVSSRYAPHNLFSDGGRVDDMVRRGARPPVNYTLWGRGGAAPGGQPALSFTVPVSPSEQPAFSWRSELNGWQRTEPDTGVFIDANGGKPVIAGTVVVMQVQAGLNPNDIESGCCTTGWEYLLSGNGPVQVFTGGTMYTGAWSEPAAGGPPQFTVNGVPAPIGAGLVWICLVPSGQPATPH